MRINPITNTFLTFKENKQDDVAEIIKKMDEEARIDKSPKQDEFIKTTSKDNLINKKLENIKNNNPKQDNKNNQTKTNLSKPKDKISFKQE